VSRAGFGPCPGFSCKDKRGNTDASRRWPECSDKENRTRTSVSGSDVIKEMNQSRGPIDDVMVQVGQKSTGRADEPAADSRPPRGRAFGILTPEASAGAALSSSEPETLRDLGFAAWTTSESRRVPGSGLRQARLQPDRRDRPPASPPPGHAADHAGPRRKPIRPCHRLPDAVYHELARCVTLDRRQSPRGAGRFLVAAAGRPTCPSPRKPP